MGKDKLEPRKEDFIASFAKGAVGAVPMIGPAIAELLGSIIPNQRLDRVVTFLEELERRLTSVEVKVLSENTLAIDLFEDAVIVASRALTNARNKHVVAFMKSSVSTNLADYEIRKKLLYILQELTDRDIEILRSIQVHGYQLSESEKYPVSISEASFRTLSEHEKIDYYATQEVWPLHILTLERAGLLKAHREKQDSDSTNRHLDMETGLPTISSYEISKLGDVFLALISEGDDNK